MAAASWIITAAATRLGEEDELAAFEVKISSGDTEACAHSAFLLSSSIIPLLTTDTTVQPVAQALYSYHEKFRLLVDMFRHVDRQKMFLDVINDTLRNHWLTWLQDCSESSQVVDTEDPDVPFLTSQAQADLSGRTMHYKETLSDLSLHSNSVHDGRVGSSSNVSSQVMESLVSNRDTFVNGLDIDRDAPQHLASDNPGFMEFQRYDGYSLEARTTAAAFKLCAAHPSSASWYVRCTKPSWRDESPHFTVTLRCLGHIKLPKRRSEIRKLKPPSTSTYCNLTPQNMDKSSLAQALANRCPTYRNVIAKCTDYERQFLAFAIEHLFDDFWRTALVDPAAISGTLKTKNRPEYL